MAGRRVLITGAANPWGTALAERLAELPGVSAVLGLDTRPLPAALEGLVEPVRVDLRSPALGAAVHRTGADVVVHNDILQFPEPGRSGRHLHDVNVVGTLQLLAALDGLPRLRALVVRGSAAIYGSEANAPFFFTEDLAGRFPPRTRFQRDVAELEGLVDGFARRHAAVTCTVLRLAPVVGRGLGTPVQRLLGLPVVPTVMGYDPRVQVLDSEDAVGALVRAVESPVRGAVNVAAPDVVSLSHALRVLGKPRLPVAAPFYGRAVELERRIARLPPLPPEVHRWMRFGRGVDTTRMTRDLGFAPRHGTLDALRRATG